MEFSDLGLGPEVLASIEALEYESPTPIQEKAIPLALAGGDLLACAQTGTGKTAAFVLPVLQRIPHKGRIAALIVTPTRELAVQIEKVARIAAHHTHHAVLAVYGGVGYKAQLKALHHGVDLLVATPGRLLDLQGRGEIDLTHVEVLVLDEADRMLDMGFWPDVRRILRLLPKERQNMLFSATLTDAVLRVIGDTLTDPVRVDVAPSSTPVEAIDQLVYPVNSMQKTELLVALLAASPEYRAIVFTRTKARADRVAAALKSSGVPSGTIHSDFSQARREQTLEQFRSGKHALLVATDVMARGIDVDHITHVVNYDVPDRPDDYVHRIGRTARAGETGIAVTLVSHEELSLLAEIERVMGRALELRDVEGFEYSERVVPREDRPAGSAKPRAMYSGGVMGRGRGPRKRGPGRRF
ncbi:MAG: DEAD/DEAH box helicase [Actinomycetota bacterium]|jgi:ATP-dependent RNA helicase RhlE|nr:DEAD/DEAH box helicase [Actinomycetota bacterium]MDZ4178250.1 DEAD/DEAH box helicase [Coriobacteriia bacterium]